MSGQDSLAIERTALSWRRTTMSGVVVWLLVVRSALVASSWATWTAVAATGIAVAGLAAVSLTRSRALARRWAFVRGRWTASASVAAVLTAVAALLTVRVW